MLVKRESSMQSGRNRKHGGMREEAIQEIFKYDWVKFNVTRKFYRYLENVDVEQILEETCDTLEVTLVNGQNYLIHQSWYEQSENCLWTT